MIELKQMFDLFIITCIIILKTSAGQTKSRSTSDKGKISKPNLCHF